MDNESHKKQLFQKFINDECSDAEYEEVMAYLHASEIPPEFEALMLENLEQKFAAQSRMPPELSTRLYDSIQEKIKASPSKKRQRFFPMLTKLMAAAVFLLLLLGGLYFYLPVFQSSAQVYVTAYGETQELLLPDGSRVVLNANSRLSYAEDWHKGLQQSHDFVREVWLEGEGIFEVEKLDKPSRFIVHTQGLEVEVLGTTFNVNARAQKTRVVLEEGKVKVKSADKAELVMQPGELVELAENDNQFQKKQVNPDHYMAWRHNELVFEATPLTEVTELLENNYGYEVTILQGAVKPEMLFTAKVPADNTELLLKMISESFDIRILQEDNELIFRQ